MNSTWFHTIQLASRMATLMAGCLTLLVSTVLLLGCCTATLQANNSLKYRSASADAETRCELSLQGLLNYYWKNDPVHKKIQFLFACGQIGEIGTANPGQCSCYSPTSCVNCYRWWTAITVESVATYGIYMNTTNHSALPNIVYSHSPYNAQYIPSATYLCTFIDDFLWYGIAYLRVYDWLHVSHS